MANSKLNSVQKLDRKSMIEEYIDDQGGFFHIAHGVTLLIVPMGKLANVSVSIMSDDETKFRRKVGEYHALRRMYIGQCIMFPYMNIDADVLDDFCSFLSLTPSKEFAANSN